MSNSINDKYIELFLQDPNYYIGVDWKIYTNRPPSGPIGKRLYPWRNIVRINEWGYEFFTYNGKYLRVHRTIYRFYYGHIDERTINHIDGNKLNNNPLNLELITIQENIQHSVNNHLLCHGENSPHSILNKKDIFYIKDLVKHGYTDKYISSLFGVHRLTIWKIRHGKIWKHV